ncbi:hypothetical protein Ngar_c18260 [Candidatus Nitrososphaera gargensis Ga9.2]|uniref:Uncharacterized protein n=1 Tax=Nitrososphaera gargensis (strain Ga9.2) TaxID=1237085 RepID=K0IN50_NITGG|nr:hypothetical protein [Candidatus Nitrososphaera gargensis]AFU58759.1 hypothetical protein Ngar_c18260 [Candidatus Nitrososphaera gargensis Ga9.2]
MKDATTLALDHEIDTLGWMWIKIDATIKRNASGVSDDIVKRMYGSQIAHYN